MPSIANKCFRRGAVLLYIGSILCALSVQGQSPPSAPEKPSNIDLMIKVVLSDKSETALRQDTTRALLLDEQAHPALIDLLREKDDNNTTAKIVICRAIAGLDGMSPIMESPTRIPKSFIDPLFQNLLHKDAELAYWAAGALVKCRNGVTVRLAEMVADPARKLAERLACIGALELFPGKEPVTAIGGLLKDEHTQIRERAAKALTEMLYLPSPLNVEWFLEKLLPRFKEMDESTFLCRQLERHKIHIRRMDDQLKEYRQQRELWRRRFFEAQKEKFNLLAEPQEKLAFLKKFLIDEKEGTSHIWALQQMNEWSKTAAVRTGPTAEQLVNLATQFISEKHPQARRLAATILAQLDFGKAQPTAPALLEQLKKEDDPSTQAALLSALGTFEFVPALEQACDFLELSDQPDVLVQAARAVGGICAAKSNTITAERIEQAASRIAQSYSDATGNVELKSELIRVMKRIAEQEKYQPAALKNFRKNLTEALTDPEPTVRGPAVYALADLLKQQVLSVLLAEPGNLLNDKDNSVRFAVITVIENLGGKDQLAMLRLRLENETDSDVAQKIVAAFGKILTFLSIDDAYYWTLQFKAATDKEQLLREQVIRILQDKIAKARSDNAETNLVKYETLSLAEQAEIAEQKNQPEQAAVLYLKLMGLPLSQAAKEIYHEKNLALALVLIDRQEKLITAKDGRENPEVITLLARLHPELNDYPSLDAPLEHRLAALKKFRKIIQEPSSPQPETK